ncbi:MAG: tRNA (N6-threonylcarbamoyladenosine(37)-N6)-methyltransferase TrmO [Anaerolineales bacterium]|nr:tRNA (N6-threonylcarbamoyladenosine(37)-N6)-methyltransferase TrmO [Anaerolineales bacterium]
MEINYQSIGVIHTPWKEIGGMPIQPSGAAGVRGRIEVFPQFVAGLVDLDGFSHIILLYHFHLVQEANLTVTPFLDTQPRGLFSTRAPKRPNPIGISVVRLTNLEENVLAVEGIDVLDGTPLLDIKPYVPEFDHHAGVRLGWLESAQGRSREKRSDDRFQ